MDDSLPVEDDCPADSVVDGCQVDSAPDDWLASADCPAEAGSPEDCSYPAGRWLRVDFQEPWAARSADCRGDFQLPEVVAAEPEAQ